MAKILWHADLFLALMCFFAAVVWTSFFRILYLWYREEFPVKGKIKTDIFLTLNPAKEILSVLFFSLCLTCYMEYKEFEIGSAEKTLFMYVMTACL